MAPTNSSTNPMYILGNWISLRVILFFLAAKLKLLVECIDLTSWKDSSNHKEYYSDNCKFHAFLLNSHITHLQQEKNVLVISPVSTSLQTQSY